MTRTRTSTTHPIRVDWLLSPMLPQTGRIGMTFAPGKKGPAVFGPPWDRDLEADLLRLQRQYGIDVLVCLMEQHELNHLKVPDLLTLAAGMGMIVRHFPVPDLQVPQVAACAELVDWIIALVAQGKNVVLHCRGGRGRTGLVAACCLVRAGHGPAEAVAVTRRCRDGTIETAVQERFVDGFGRRAHERT